MSTRQTAPHARNHAVLPWSFPGGALRRLRTGDLALFQAYRGVPELGRFQGWSAMSDAEAAAFLAEMNEAPLFAAGEWIQLAIAEAHTDRLIGDVGIFVSADGRSGEIGFTLAPEAQGRGIATVAARRALQALFGETNVKHVLGITDSRNAASIRVLERLGFRQRERRETLFRGEACIEVVYVLVRGDGPW